MVIQHNMARNSSFFYHASAPIPRANHSDFFNTHACYASYQCASLSSLVKSNIDSRLRGA